MGKIWTADELMAMTPERRQELFDANSTGAIDEIPQHLLARARQDVQSHIEATETAQAIDR